MSSIASSSNSTPPSQVDLPPAFKVYRRYNDKDDWDGDIFLDKTRNWEIYNPAAPPPPYVVLVQGPPNVGKSLLIKSLVKYFTEEHRDDIRGPITILTGDKDNRRRLQFVECPDDINYMIDAVKYADLVLILVDASCGFEAETFEFVNLLRAHSFPPVVGVLTHLDAFKDESEMDKTKVRLHNLFQTEIYLGAKISCLSGLHLHSDLYKMSELKELAENILMLQFYLSSWRAAYPYVLVDHFEDVTPPEKRAKDANCNRNLSLYGYLRGCNIRSRAKVHIAGLGDFLLADVRSTADPHPVKENGFTESTHMENETFRTGAYLRLEVHDVPFRIVQNLDPCHPILVGGISLKEENVGHMQARLKRHKWHMKLLKSADPVTVSAGWRRYQTKPVYALERDDGQHPFMEFNSEHGNCLAMFWGPLAPPRTRIAVVQSNKDVFRIVAKAVILDPKHDSKIVKQSMWLGTPLKMSFGTLKISKNADVAKQQAMIMKVLKKKGTHHKIHKRRAAPVKPELQPVHQVEVPSSFDPVIGSAGIVRKEQRRRVEIVDVEPTFYPCSSDYMLVCGRDRSKETVVVMSEVKRAELVDKQQEELFEKEEKEFVGVRQLLDS